MVFLLFLLDGTRIRIRIRIQEAQKLTDPTDADADPDPQYGQKGKLFLALNTGTFRGN
jgi:hypothetical protein